MIRTIAFLTASAIGLAACDAPTGQSVSQPRQINAGFTVAPPNAPSGPAVDAFARNFLNTIQAQSFRGRREYCGYFFVGANGQLQATTPIAGTFASCDMPVPRVGQGIVASYHTHGSYATAYDNEVPSAIDLISDFDYGIDGYVSTPGGRVWLVDFQTFSTRQVCGVGCVLQDPNFVPNPSNPVQRSYTLREIQTRNANF